jgi:hypothetical protein
MNILKEEKSSSDYFVIKHDSTSEFAYRYNSHSWSLGEFNTNRSLFFDNKEDAEKFIEIEKDNFYKSLSSSTENLSNLVAIKINEEIVSRWSESK